MVRIVRDLLQVSDNQGGSIRREYHHEVMKQVAAQGCAFGSKNVQARDDEQKQRKDGEQEIEGQFVGAVNEIILKNGVPNGAQQFAPGQPSATPERGHTFLGGGKVAVDGGSIRVQFRLEGFVCGQ